MGKLYDGLGGLSTTTGTGTYVITGPITGYIPFSTITDNDLLDLVVRGPGNFREVGEYRKIGGASAQLQRVNIYATHDDLDGGVNVDWPAGEKQIYSAMTAANAVSRRLQNTWLDHQLFAGKRVVLSPDGESYIYSSADDFINFNVSTAQCAVMQYISSMFNLLLKSSDGGSAAGPILRFERNNPTPGANQNIGQISFHGRDSIGNVQIYSHDVTMIVDPTNGSEDASRYFYIIGSGSEHTSLLLAYDGVRINPNGLTNLEFRVNKNSASLTDPGMLFTANNTLVVTTAASNTPLICVRSAGSGGYFASFHFGSTPIGHIQMVGTTAVFYETFIGAHLSDNDPAFPSIIPLAALPTGTVVCATDAVHSEGQPWLPKWRLPFGRADRDVYGVYTETETPGADSISGLGQWQCLVTGPVRQGDLLITANTLGHACVQDDDIVRGSTIGKCRRTDLGSEPRLVPCTLMCG